MINSAGRAAMPASGVAEMKLMPGPTWAWLIILGVAN